MKKTILLSVLAALCLFGTADAQETNPIKPLQTGDTLPPLTIQNVYHYKDQRIDLSQIKDQLLILDFWATWCSSCIAVFPRSETIEQQFKGKVSFLAVNSKDTRDDKAKVTAFFVKHPEFTFPYVAEDTVLMRLFPHHALPHYVWLKDGKVAAITGAEAIHADTIARFLQNQDTRLETKTDRPFQMNRPIFLNQNGGEATTYINRSILTPYTAGLPNSFYLETSKGDSVSRIQLVNQSRMDMAHIAWPELSRTPTNRQRLQVSDTADYRSTGGNNDWNKQNRFVYESSFPAISKAAALAYLQKELGRYFNMRLDSAYRKTKCLVITQARDRKESTTTGEAQTNWYDDTNGTVSLTDPQ